MFQPGIYRIESVSGEASTYGYLEVVSKGEGEWTLGFYSADSEAEWPVPAPTEDLSYRFTHYEDELPPKVGEGTMRSIDWPTSSNSVQTKEGQPGPIWLQINEQTVFYGFASGDMTETQGFYGVSHEFPEWPIALGPSQTAFLALGPAENINDLTDLCENTFGKDWSKRGAEEYYAPI